MVYKCFVYGCKTHKLPKHTTFGVPKDPELLWRWEVALRPYSNGKELQSKHRVCKAHFRPEELDMYYTHLIQGTEVKIERGRPELKKGAVPSIFPGQKKPPRRVLQYKNGEKEKKTQSILLLSGEWVHLKNNDIPEKPAQKRIYKKNVPKSASDTFKLESSNCQPKNTDQKQKKSSCNSRKISGDTRTDELIQQEVLNKPGLLPWKPPDKEMSGICINWDALPLPEEIGSLLCDSLVPTGSSNSDFHFQSPKSVSSSLSKSMSVPDPILSKDLSPEPISEGHLSTPDYIHEYSPEVEGSPVISFQGLLMSVSQIEVPSQMWGVHTDHTRVYFSCMSYTGCIAVPRVEKIVMYQSCMVPRVFLRGIEVSVSTSEKKCSSLEEVEDLLQQVDNLKLCLGIDSAKDVVYYSSDCEIFVESGRLPRCPTCRKERLVECSKKRHLETDHLGSSPRPPKRKQVLAK